MDKLLLPLCLLMVLACVVSATAQPPWEVSRPAASFDRHLLTDETKLAQVTASGNLTGTAGWYDYDLQVPATGWYEILLQPDSGNTEVLVDGEQYTACTGGAQAGNFWMTAGKHTVRLQRFTWTGFQPVTGLTVRAAAAETGQALRVAVKDLRNLVRRGQTLNLEVTSGGASAGKTLTAVVSDTRPWPWVQVATYPLTLPAAAGVTTTLLPIPAPQEGSFAVEFKDGAQGLDSHDVPAIRYTVVDTTLVPRPGGEVKRTLIASVDCVTQAPDYTGGGATRVITKPFGSYRESGDVGWLQHMNSTEPSWFAYKVTVPQPQAPYLVEVDYPNDALRTYCIAVRDSSPGAYPTAGGVDSGGEFSLSNTMQTETILHWTSGTDLRVLIITAQTGLRAAAARIRVYKLDEPLPPLNVPVHGGRSFANWYEEGGSFLGVYAAPNGSLDGTLVAADRWARSVAYMGGDTLWMTGVVYQFGMYPTLYNQSYGGLANPDQLGTIALEAEKYGLNFIAEFHPEARDIPWAYQGQPDPKPYAAISRLGKVSARSGEPPYNCLFPACQNWYLGMLGEFADRYAYSPAFQGVSLRLMSWVNPGLNNFGSLDWGYDDYTVGLFVKETGLPVPGKPGDPARFTQRYDWLMAHAKERWISWRCEKIAELYRKIVARVRKARPDLRVYTDNFGLNPNLREAGLDAALLSKIDGVVPVNAPYGYGRRQQPLANQETRDGLLDKTLRDAFRAAGQPASYLFGAGYFEATGDVATPEDLGYPAGTKRIWMSGVVNPAGRASIERWAIGLAEGDATLMADGGNAYTLGQPILREFLQEYRCLPPVAFASRADARDPVTVRQLARPQDFLFYAVNRERYPVQVRCTLATSGLVKRLSSGETLALHGNVLAFELAPFQLLTFTAPAGTQIQQVSVKIPAADLQLVQEQVAWLQGLAATVKAHPGDYPALTGEQRATLARDAEDARTSLAQGWYWHARTLMEHHLLLPIYDICNAYPPHLRQNGTPITPAGAVDAAALAEHLQAGQSATVEASESVIPTWGATPLLVSRAPDLTFTLQAPIDSRYRLNVGYASGADFGPLEVLLNGKSLGVLSDPGPEAHGVGGLLPNLVSLPQGPVTVTFHRLSGARTALSFFQWTPILRDIVAKNWRVVGPYRFGQDLSSDHVYDALEPAMKQAFPPEAKRDFSAPVTLQNGQTATWTALTGDSPYVDLYAYSNVLQGSVNYAVTYLHSPVAHRVRLTYGVDYWAKIWMNGQLVQDFGPHGGAPFKGQFSVDVDLQPGWNELLMKVASGSGGNGLWMAISDPGDLTYANQPAPPAS